MKGYYFAERGGMFMSAVLKSMTKGKKLESSFDRHGRTVSPGQDRHRFSHRRPGPYGSAKKEG
jgi:ribosomal protein L3